MLHPSIKEAIGQSEELQRLRSGEDMIPPPNYDIALCLYERNEDGTDSEEPFLSVGFRPQLFAIDPNMKYTRFAVHKTHKREGKTYLVAFLVHLYWDGSRDEDSAIEAVLEVSHVFGYGQWEPTAPSDPLKEDDFWNHDELGEPPNGYWDDILHWDEEERSKFTPFNNFAREPYEKVSFGNEGDDA